MTKRAFLLALVLLGGAKAQTYNNATLSAKYYFRELYFATDSTGNPTDIRSATGAIVFDGQGGYGIIANENMGVGAAAPLTINGTYSVSSNAAITISDPLVSSLSINARYTAEAVFGSSSDSTGNTFSFFIAIPEPTGGYTAKTLSGTYFVSTFEITAANAATARSALILSMQPDGKGNIPGFNLNGHAANVDGGNPFVAFNPGSTYTVNSDGSGAINFGPVNQSQFVSGTKPIYISKSGNMFIGASTDPGVLDLMIGVKAMSTTPAPTNASWSGTYFTAGLRLQVNATQPTSSCYTGGLNSNGNVALLTRRLHQVTIPNTFSYTSSQAYTVNPDASVFSGYYAAGLGAAGLFVDVEGGQLSQADSSGYEIDFGSVIPTFTAGSVFINPYGIVNAASNAPGGAPLSPGEFVTVFGSNLATATMQAGAPYPLTLGGVTVTVNGTPAPIYLVSAGQINFLVPYEVTGSTASVVVKNSTGTSNTVALPLSATSPGIYSIDFSGAGNGVVLHADYSLVTAAKPAVPGETVQVFLTGLGAVKPTIADGVAAPSSPLSLVALTSQQLNVYMYGQPAAVQFAGLAPGFPGLYQLNVTIPASLTATGAVDLAINTPDAFTDQVFVQVQAPQ